MFKSFFPKPGPFFISAFIWSLLAVIFWQAGGGDWLLRVTGASQNVAISAARFWSLNYLVFHFMALAFLSENIRSMMDFSKKQDKTRLLINRYHGLK